MNKILVGIISFAFAIVLSGCATTANTAKDPDAAVDAFLRDYVGVQFGDDISKINGYEDTQYMIPMQKEFQYFDKVCTYYRKGKLYRVNVWADIGKEYSQNSTEEQIRKTLSALEKELSLPQNYFAAHSRGDFRLWKNVQNSSSPSHNPSYSVTFASKDWPNFRRYCLDIVDTALDQSLKSGVSPKFKTVSDDVRRNWGIPLPDAD